MGMDTRRVLATILVAASILTAASYSQGQGFSTISGLPRYQGLPGAPPDTGFYAFVGMRKYFSSFTSYQFPDPVQVQLNPISRLEWPWEQICGVAKVSYGSRLFELNFEYASTGLAWSGLKAQDSDWVNPDNPGQKIIFSQGKAMPRVWTFDMSFALTVPSTPWVKGIAGFRAQEFRFTATDGIEGTIGMFDANDNFIGYLPVAQFRELPGPGIEFSQYYKHFYLGGVLASGLNLGIWAPALGAPVLYVRFQADAAYVTGKNHDQHLLRTDSLGLGVQRDTFENTRGWSWHLNLITALRITSYARIEVEGDFKRVKTTGDHKLYEYSPTDGSISRGWTGAKVWSEQAFVGVNGAVRF